VKLKNLSTITESKRLDVNIDVKTDISGEKYNSYDSDHWDKTYFDEVTGGYVVTHKGHKFDSETGKYEKETAVILAINGYKVEMMDESDFRKRQYDIRINGIPTEIKVMNGYRNIHKRAVEASEQDATRIVYYIKFKDNHQMYNRFNNVYKTVEKINEIWFIKDNKLHYFTNKKTACQTD
jgi:hypothetical protein